MTTIVLRIDSSISQRSHMNQMSDATKRARSGNNTFFAPVSQRVILTTHNRARQQLE
jgi:hypothetical protein